MRLKNLLLVLCSSCMFAQNTFNYQRDWGTYFGGVNTGIIGLYEDSASDIYLDASTNSPNPTVANVPASYYNQFITPGSGTYTGSSVVYNNFSGKFSSAGNLLSAGYSPYSTSLALTKSPFFRDEDGNIYEFQKDLLSFPTLSSGTWLSNQISSDNIILTKYDVHNNIVWQTYLPGNSNFTTLEVDNSGNIYIGGTTQWQNLGDPGTFQPTFSTVYVPGGLLPNSFIVKLNPQGQKIWATYTPSSLIAGITAFNNKLYIFGNSDSNPAGSELSTPGTFQSAKSNQFVAEFDGNTGQRVWGTYYGIPGGSGSGMSDIKADETGVYIVGMTFAIPGNYFATEGAYRDHSSDGVDVFITKFSNSGARVWSTYIGTDGVESYSGDRELDIKNGKLLFTGFSYGTQNIATPGAYVGIKPNPDGEDMFFGILNTNDGSPDFISYYGGTGSNTVASSIGCSFLKHSDGFFLYGSTQRKTGYGTANGYQPDIIYPTGITMGSSSFIAKFSQKVLATSEINAANDLVLYNNPNNGNFSLKGSDLDKEPHSITITDTSGRLLYSENIQKNKEKHFNLENLLTNGNYLLSVFKSDKTLIKNFKLIIKK